MPGAALAMYQCANPEAKKKTASLLLSAALTSALTGITEPIEFSFLFVAPLLYVVHVLLAATCFVVAQALQVAIGFTFSAGLLDFTLFGILQEMRRQIDDCSFAWLSIFLCVLWGV